MVGFFGMDKYEMLTYLARILTKLGDRVLLADFAESGAVTKSLPGYLYNNMLRESSGDEVIPIEYRGVHYLDLINYPAFHAMELLRSAAAEYRYDTIMIDLGFNDGNVLMSRCDKVVFVTDQQLHNIKDIWTSGLEEGKEAYLVLKDVYECRIKKKEILDRLSIDFESENVFEIPHDDIDAKARIMSLYDDDTLHFQRLSKPLQNFLMGFAGKLHPEIDNMMLLRACRRAG